MSNLAIGKTILLGAAVAVFLVSCGESATQPEPTEAAVETVDVFAETQQGPNVVHLKAVGMRFEGPAEIPAGWTTFDFENASDMLHFGIIDVPPAEVTGEDFANDVAVPFQEAMDGINTGDEAATNAAFGKFPAWIGEMGRSGGPGFLSAGRSGQTTVFLSPGQYYIECYIKTGGMFHTTPSEDRPLGMLLPITVTESDVERVEPEANVTINVTNNGYEIADGALVAGANTVRVNFVEQQALPTFVGNDIHLARLEGENDLASVDRWMDWSAPEGLESPAPVTFLGGINDLPAGSHGHFTVDLQPGDYAFVGEQPGPIAAGFVLEFSVSSPD